MKLIAARIVAIRSINGNVKRPENKVPLQENVKRFLSRFTDTLLEIRGYPMFS